MTNTWNTLAERLKAGDEVIFETPLEYGAHGQIAKGTIARVIENALNEMCCMLVVRVDGDDGDVYIPGPGHVGTGWNKPAVVTQVVDIDGEKWRVTGVGTSLTDGKQHIVVENGDRQKGVTL